MFAHHRPKFTLAIFIIIFSMMLFNMSPTSSVLAGAQDSPLFAGGGDLVWAKGMGGSGGEEGDSIAVDSNGNVFTVGVIPGTADFDPGPDVFNLTGRIFVSKLNSSGNFVWAKSWGTTLSDVVTGIAVDGSGNVYTTGSYDDTVDFDPGPAIFNLTAVGSHTDVFISKLDGNGNFVWAKSFGVIDDSDVINSIAVDLNSSVYTTGAYYSTVDFDPGAGTFDLTSQNDSWDIFISKLDSSGKFVWAKSIGGASMDSAMEVIIDPEVNIYSTGSFRGTADFDPGSGTFNLTSLNDSWDIFVLKLEDPTNTDVIIGNAEQASYTLSSQRSMRKRYFGVNNGPVEIVSTDDNSILSSQRVIYGGVSYSEMIGLPFEQLSKEYLFPYYNNVAMQSQLRVSNLGDVPTTITVYLGTQEIDSFPLAAGAADRKSYPNTNSGPLRVVSTDTDILTTNRVLYGSKSYSELMGLPVEALSQEYWYPVYDNVSVNSQLRVSNVGAGQAHITVYLGTQQIDEYDLQTGEASRRTYPHNGGPLRVVSDPEPILSTIRLLYQNNSYAEITGLPVEQLSKESLYPVYDNVSLGSQLRVANVGANPTTITVNLKGVQIDSFELAAGSEVRKSYPKNNGPLQVTSSIEPIVTSIRHLYTTATFASFYELMGLPNTELSTQYFFPWYNNTAMNSELRFAVP